jgi:cytidylate kinase
MAIVTIRGQRGSGAHQIGKQVARRLHFDYVDREILSEVARTLKVKSLEVQMKETPPSTFFGRVAEVISRIYSINPACPDVTLPTWHPPLDDACYIETLEQVIKSIAQNQSVVICGRGSQFILHDSPDALHVLTIAPLEVRVNRVMNEMKIDEAEASQEIEKVDTSRRAFIKRYFHVDMENPEHHHLTINTGRIDDDAAASLIIEVVKRKYQA